MVAVNGTIVMFVVMIGVIILLLLMILLLSFIIFYRRRKKLLRRESMDKIKSEFIFEEKIQPTLYGTFSFPFYSLLFAILSALPSSLSPFILSSLLSFPLSLLLFPPLPFCFILSTLPSPSPFPLSPSPYPPPFPFPLYSLLLLSFPLSLLFPFPSLLLLSPLFISLSPYILSSLLSFPLSPLFLFPSPLFPPLSPLPFALSFHFAPLSSCVSPLPSPYPLLLLLLLITWVANPTRHPYGRVYPTNTMGRNR